MMALDESKEIDFIIHPEGTCVPKYMACMAKHTDESSFKNLL